MRSSICVLCCFCVIQLGGAAEREPAQEAIVKLVTSQRDALLALAPFKIEYKTEGSGILDNGKEWPFPSKSGIMILGSDGRFVIFEKFGKEPSDVSSFAWDGDKLYRGPDKHVTFFVSSDRFASYNHLTESDEPSEEPRKVPFIDLYETISEGQDGSSVSLAGTALRPLGLDAFSYVTLYDAYIDPVIGKLGPRWCDIVDRSVVDENLRYLVGTQADGNEGVVFTVETPVAPRFSRFRYVFNFEGLEREGTVINRVKRLERQGPWLSWVTTRVGKMSLEDFEKASRGWGNITEFLYSDDIADGLFPTGVRDVFYEPVDKGEVESSEILGGKPLRVINWKAFGFRRLTEKEFQSAMEQFVMTQKNLEDIASGAKWNQLHGSNDSDE